jgi:AraC-like DNA-binding protein
MQEHSSLPLLLSAGQRQQVALIFVESEIALISCHFWRMAIPSVIPTRRLADSFLYVPLVGRLCCRVGAEERVLGPGDAMLVAEGVEHEARLAEGCDYFESYSLHAHAYTAQSTPLFAILATPFVRLEPPAFWQEQLALLTHLLGTTPEVGRRFGEPLLRQLLLCQLLQGNLTHEIPSPDDPRVWKAIYRMLTDYAAPLTVTALAREACLSPVQFRLLFKRDTGLSPRAYLQGLRLRKARALLQTNPQLTIKEVAEQTGLGDPHYLHAVFKAAYGMTPGACRSTLPDGMTA